MWGGTPRRRPGLAGSSAQWLGDDQLLLIRQEGPGAAALDGSFSTRAGLSVYSFHTQSEIPLGEVVLQGGCGTATAKVVCPTEHGFTLYH